MNIFEDMKVFIKPLGVVSPVSEINVNSDSVFTPYGIYEVKDVFLILKTGLKDKNNKAIYVGDVLTDGENEYQVYFNENKGFTLIDRKNKVSSPHFLTGDSLIHFAISQCEIISNIYVEMQERVIQNEIFKKSWLCGIQVITKDIL